MFVCVCVQVHELTARVAELTGDNTTALHPRLALAHIYSPSNPPLSIQGSRFIYVMLPPVDTPLSARAL